MVSRLLLCPGSGRNSAFSPEMDCPQGGASRGIPAPAPPVVWGEPRASYDYGGAHCSGPFEEASRD
jgi:hypothetical protein